MGRNAEVSPVAEAADVSVPAASRSWSPGETAAWCMASVAFVCLAYGVVWQRGSYADDYALRDLACDVVNGTVRPIWSLERITTFPVRTLNWVVAGAYAASIPQHEMAARSLAAFSVAINALLWSWLIYRILHSRLAALVAGWMFLAPFHAHEALLWASASGYLVGTFLALLSLHCFLSALMCSRRTVLWFAVGTLPLICGLFAIEQAIVILAVLPLLGLCVAMRESPGQYRRLATRSAFLVGGMACALFLFVLVVYRGAAQVTGRGGFVKSPVELLERCGQFSLALPNKTVSTWGMALTREAFWSGLQVQRTNGYALALLLVAVSAVTLLTARWRGRSSDYEAPARAGWMLLFTSLLGFFLTLCLPGAMLRGQILEYRMLYVPSAFAGAAMAACLWLAGSLIARLRWVPAYEKTILPLLGLGTWFCITCVLGFASAYAQRSQLDQKQLAAARDTLSLAQLPPKTLIIPFGNDEILSPQITSTSKLLAGVFEMPFAAWPEVSRILASREFRLLTTNRWVGMTFVPVEQADGPKTFTMNGRAVLPAEALILTYRDGHEFVVDELVIRRDGEADLLFTFPLAEKFTRAGAPRMKGIVPANVPQFHLSTQ